MKLQGPWMYRLVWRLGLVVLKIWTRLKFVNKQNLPKEGGAVLCCNHINALDFLPVALGTKRYVTILAKEDLIGNPLIRWIVDKAGVITVRRGEADIQAIKQMLLALKNGGLVMVFPEGTRNRDRANTPLLPLQNGAAMLALKANVPLIPVWIKGRYSPFTGLSTTYGAPVDLEKFRGERKPDLNEATQLLRAAMLELSGSKG